MDLTVSRFSYPWHLRSLSRALSPLTRVPSLGCLKPASVAKSAFTAAGIEEPRDPVERQSYLGSEFDDALTKLALEPFPALGKIHWRAALTSATRTRIWLEHYLKQGLPVADIEEPIFVCGLPRTGTSLVQRLIAQDPTRRGLMHYELLSPVPPPHSNRFLEARRRMLGTFSHAVYRTFTPELLKIHHTTVTSLEECWMLFMPSYAVLNADYMFKSDHFGDWLLGDFDMTGAYRRYSSMLGILANDAPGQKYVLKSPEHLWFLPELFEVFPKARVIWTHRDPSRAVPSYCAQISLLRRQHRGQVDTHGLGRNVLHRFRQGVDRASAFCDQNPDARIYHLDYKQLVADPIATLQDCYQKLGLEMSSEHEQAMSDFMQSPHRDRNQNRYRADVFGLEPEGIQRAFADYMNKYDVQAEPTRS